MRLCARCGTGFDARDWHCPHCGSEPALIGPFPAFAPALAAGAPGFDPAHFTELARLEAGNFWFRARNRLIVWALERYFPAARSFLEVGCGTGFVLAGIAGAAPGLRLAGSEAAPQGLEHAARRVPAAELIQMDAQRIPYRDEFDAAGAFDVIEHIDDDRAVLREIRGALVPGGGLILTVPQHPFLWSAYDARAGHRRRYRAAELREKVAEAGFEIVRMTSFVTLLLPAMIVSRKRPGGPGADGDPLAELRIAPWLNRVLEKVLDFERMLIRAGLALPVGGSLLLVARRPMR